MEKKLTLVSFMCNRRVVRAFLNLTVQEDGKVRVTQKQMDKLFMEQHGFTPQLGDTISIGI